MTLRQEYIREIARLAVDSGVVEFNGKMFVVPPSFTEEQFLHHYNAAGREYYNSLTQAQLKRLDNDINLAASKIMVHIIDELYAVMIDKAETDLGRYGLALKTIISSTFDLTTCYIRRK